MNINITFIIRGIYFFLKARSSWVLAHCHSHSPIPSSEDDFSRNVLPLRKFHESNNFYGGLDMITNWPFLIPFYLKVLNLTGDVAGIHTYSPHYNSIFSFPPFSRIIDELNRCCGRLTRLGAPTRCACTRTEASSTRASRIRSGCLTWIDLVATVI